jgi:hypothetical protein
MQKLPTIERKTIITTDNIIKIRLVATINGITFGFITKIGDWFLFIIFLII